MSKWKEREKVLAESEGNFWAFSCSTMMHGVLFWSKEETMWKKIKKTWNNEYTIVRECVRKVVAKWKNTNAQGCSSKTFKVYNNDMVPTTSWFGVWDGEAKGSNATY